MMSAEALLVWCVCDPFTAIGKSAREELTSPWCQLSKSAIRFNRLAVMLHSYRWDLLLLTTVARQEYHRHAAVIFRHAGPLKDGTELPAYHEFLLIRRRSISASGSLGTYASCDKRPLLTLFRRRQDGWKWGMGKVVPCRVTGGLPFASARRSSVSTKRWRCWIAYFNA